MQSIQRPYVSMTLQAAPGIPAKDIGQCQSNTGQQRRAMALPELSQFFYLFFFCVVSHAMLLSGTENGSCRSDNLCKPSRQRLPAQVFLFCAAAQRLEADLLGAHFVLTQH